MYYVTGVCFLFRHSNDLYFCENNFTICFEKFNGKQVWWFTDFILIFMQGIFSCNERYATYHDWNCYFSLWCHGKITAISKRPLFATLLTELFSFLKPCRKICLNHFICVLVFPVIFLSPPISDNSIQFITKCII